MARGVLWIGVIASDPEQGHSEVAKLLHQAVQRCRIDDGPRDDGGAVPLVGEAQSVEPGGQRTSRCPLTLIS